MNRPTLRAVPLLLCAALGGGLLAGCGDADDASGTAAAQATLQQTVDATSELQSARVRAGFSLAPDGMLALGGPIAVRAAGPFASGDEGELPRFAFALAGTLARTDLRARAISTGKRIYLRIDGKDYVVGKGLRAKSHSGAKAHRGGLASLGLDPAGWVADPREQGTEVIDGVETIHIVGELDVKQVLDDVAKLLGGGAKGFDGLLTPELRKEIESAVKSTKVDVWTGAQDKILRRLNAAIDFAFENGKSPITGLDGGKVALRLQLDDVNATTVAPVAPKGARPLSDLLGEGGLDSLLSGLGAGLLGGASGGDDGAAFLDCLQAGGGTADIAACASKLAP